MGAAHETRPAGDPEGAAEHLCRLPALVVGEAEADDTVPGVAGGEPGELGGLIGGVGAVGGHDPADADTVALRRPPPGVEQAGEDLGRVGERW